MTSVVQCDDFNGFNYHFELTNYQLVLFMNLKSTSVTVALKKDVAPLKGLGEQIVSCPSRNWTPYKVMYSCTL